MALQPETLNFGTLNYVHGIQNNFGNSLAIEQILQRLHPAQMDASTRSQCQLGTRLDIISVLQKWATNPSDSRRVFWLHGLAGSGKSTLATTIANIFMASGQLCAFLFFDRDSSERNDPKMVIRTLAYQLGLIDHRIGAKIVEVIEGNPRITHSPLQLQFLKLLVEPLSLPGVLPEGHIVVVLDALDECGGAKDRKELLDLLTAEWVRLPPAMRLIFTSRQEFDIKRSVVGKSHIITQELDITTAVNRDDILSFFRHQMSAIASVYTDVLALPLDWPGDEMVLSLSERAAGLFIWAATATAFVEDGHDPRKRLRLLTEAEASPGAVAALDSLYKTALQAAGKWDDVDFRADFRAILGLILVARNPLSHDAIDSLLSIEEDRPSVLTISRLGCVLTQFPVVRILHPSFADFLCDRKRCDLDMWFIDPIVHNRLLALRCLSLLQGALKRNISGLVLSRETVNATLLEHVAYACAFWIDHVCAITEHVDLITEALHKFIFEHLMHWLEAMSILKKSRETIRMLHRLFAWAEIRMPDRQELCSLIHDGYQFSQTFYSTMEDHPLLIYLNALPFAPTESILYQTFHSKETCPWISPFFQEFWPPLLHVFPEHKSAMEIVTFSPDGKHVACESGGTIRVWDTASGADAFEPITRESKILAMAFSPDGSLIASCGFDMSIHIWDSATGVARCAPLSVPQSVVHLVAFSPDGLRLVSGSGDERIRVWGASTGLLICPPILCHSTILSVTFSLNGSCILSGYFSGSVRKHDVASGVVTHTCYLTEFFTPVYQSFSPSRDCLLGYGMDRLGWWEVESGRNICLIQGIRSVINAATFSPDEAHVACGLADGTVRVFDARLGQTVIILETYSGVMSLAFSPDTKTIIAGCDDKMVRLWETDFKRHLSSPHRFDQLLSLDISPDGSLVVTGSGDGKLRVWYSQSGELAFESPLVHNGRILAVSFSPDVSKILSCSDDGTILVFNGTGGTICRLQGHSSSVTAAAFSPDGFRVVSGSSDKSVRVWNAQSGAQLLPPFKGHEKDVLSVAFSPDGSRIVSGSADWSIIVWDAISGVILLPPMKAYPYPVNCVEFSSDGQLILSSSDAMNWTCEWDVFSGVCLPGFHRWNHHKCHTHDSIVFDKDGWIINVTTSPPQIISKIPPFSSPSLVSAWAASNTTVTLSHDDRQLVIMHFPPPD